MRSGHDSESLGERACSRRLHSIGVSETDTRPEITTAVVMVTANSRNSRPRMPPRNSTGMKTAASDTVMLRMVNPTSREPSSVARRGSAPASRWRTMFSSITIASSTTKPTDRMTAMSERLFRLKFSRRITTKVPRIENGSASAGMSVARAFWRKTKITSTTSTSVTSIVILMSLNAARIEIARIGPLDEVNRGRELIADAWQQRLDRVDDRERVAARLLLNRDENSAALAVGVEQPRGAVRVFDAVDDGRKPARGEPARPCGTTR